MSDKIQPLLAAAVQEHEANDSEQFLDVVITPSTEAPHEELLQHVEAVGGLDATLDDAVPGIQVRLPANQVSNLAESPLVSHIRMARIQQMH